MPSIRNLISLLVFSIAFGAAGPAQADWAVSMGQTNIANMSYSAMTNVGTSSFCAYDGVCGGGEGTSGHSVDTAENWFDAADEAVALNIEPADLSFAFIVAPASAQSAIEGLEDALGNTPLALLDAGTPDVMYFADVQVLRDRIDDSDFSILARYGPSMQSSAIESLGHAGSVETWEEKAGLSLQGIDYIAGGGMPPDHVTVWRLNDPQSALDGLPDVGFGPLEDGPADALANGTPGTRNPLDGDPQSPWRGMTGETAVVLPVEGGFLQSFSVEAGADFAEAGDTLANHDGSAVVLEGVAQELGEGERIAQAFVLSPIVGMPVGDPAAVLLSDDPQAGMADSAPDNGLPVFALAMLADIDGPDGNRTLVSMAYDDCGTAEAAGETFVALWRETELTGHDWTLSSSTHATGDDCAALVSIDEAGEPDGSGAYSAIFTAIASRGFAPLTFAVDQ